MPTKKLFGAKSYLLLLEQTFIVGASLCVTKSLLPVYEKKHLVKKSNISESPKQWDTSQDWQVSDAG